MRGPAKDDADAVPHDRPTFVRMWIARFLVQISAVRSEDAANEAWSRLTQRHPELFAGARKSVERADLGARGVFYRLRAGSFETREAASRFCDAYKQAGGDCIIVREE